DGKRTLAGFFDDRALRLAGRLDFDSEGLLVLSADGRLVNRIADPRYKLEKSYWAQVDGAITDEALSALRRGVTLKDGKTRPARARRIAEPEGLWPRDPPVRFRASIPTSWIELTLVEGRNRQVRRMTAATGFPTLRLVRHRIGDWRLGTLAPGESRRVAGPQRAPHRR
ncbi:MAG: pseudouridine synthase, partial [Pseudomonadota bacterium]